MSNFYSKSYTSEHAYVNGRPIKDIELTKTQKNQWVQVKGHINDRPVFYQNFRRPSRGMTAKRKRRKLRFSRKRPVKKSMPDKTLEPRK
jgi:hypothetical protein